MNHLIMSLVAVAWVSSGAGIPALTSAAEAPMPAEQAAGGDSDKCPVRAADLDKLTQYRWQVGQYKANLGFIPNGTIRIDMCELIGKDDKGKMQAGVMVNIARGAHAAAFAKHWRDACSGSIMPESRGKVQPMAGVPGGQQCVTASGTSSFYWIESPSQTIQVEGEDDVVPWAQILPKLMAAIPR